MTPDKQQKIREGFIKEYTPAVKHSGITYPETLDEIADYFLSILDKELEEEREKIAQKLRATYGRVSQPALVIIETFEGHNEQRPALEEVLDLIHNKS